MFIRAYQGKSRTYSRCQLRQIVILLRIRLFAHTIAEIAEYTVAIGQERLCVSEQTNHKTINNATETLERIEKYPISYIRSLSVD